MVWGRSKSSCKHRVVSPRGFAEEARSTRFTTCDLLQKRYERDGLKRYLWLGVEVLHPCDGLLGPVGPGGRGRRGRPGERLRGRRARVRVDVGARAAAGVLISGVLSREHA